VNVRRLNAVAFKRRFASRRHASSRKKAVKENGRFGSWSAEEGRESCVTKIRASGRSKPIFPEDWPQVSLSLREVPLGEATKQSSWIATARFAPRADKTN
jgi:hypothetical protein